MTTTQTELSDFSQFQCPAGFIVQLLLQWKVLNVFFSPPLREGEEKTRLLSCAAMALRDGARRFFPSGCGGGSALIYSVPGFKWDMVATPLGNLGDFKPRNYWLNCLPRSDTRNKSRLSTCTESVRSYRTLHFLGLLVSPLEWIVLSDGFMTQRGVGNWLALSVSADTDRPPVSLLPHLVDCFHGGNRRATDMNNTDRQKQNQIYLSVYI